jgi:hypothetical protein
VPDHETRQGSNVAGNQDASESELYERLRSEARGAGAAEARGAEEPEALLGLVNDLSPAQRTAAMELMVKLDTEGRDAVLEAVSDLTPENRELLPRLAEGLSPSHFAAALVLLMLGGTGNPKQLNAAVEAVSFLTPSERAAALHIVVSFGLLDDLVPGLNLPQSDPPVRMPSHAASNPPPTAANSPAPNAANRPANEVEHDLKEAMRAGDLTGRETAEAIQSIALAARAAGINLSSLSFDELMEIIRQTRGYTEQLRRENLEAKEREQMAEVEARTVLARVEIQKREAQVRFGLATLLVAGAVLGVVLAIALDLDAQAVAQYLAPISGLAGIAVGYFFGRQSAE